MFLIFLSLIYFFFCLWVFLSFRFDCIMLCVLCVFFSLLFASSGFHTTFFHISVYVVCECVFFMLKTLHSITNPNTHTHTYSPFNKKKTNNKTFQCMYVGGSRMCL